MFPQHKGCTPTRWPWEPTGKVQEGTHAARAHPHHPWGFCVFPVKLPASPVGPLWPTPTRQVNAEHQARPVHPKLCPPQSTKPWAGQGGRNAGVNLGWAVGSGPCQASTLGRRAPSYWGTVCPFPSIMEHKCREQFSFKPQYKIRHSKRVPSSSFPSST